MINKDIMINTGLDRFILLDSITEVSATAIVGVRSFDDSPVYLGMEALAQLGAFHIRCLTGFDRHIFLLKVAACRLSSGKSLTGRLVLSGKLVSQSAAAFTCRLKAERESEEKPLLEGEFLFASVGYDQNFKSATLHNHYEKVFTCLRNDIKPG
jgi:hypothetical protein